jgi:hypothetical protein
MVSCRGNQGGVDKDGSQRWSVAGGTKVESTKMVVTDGQLQGEPRWSRQVASFLDKF